VVKKTFFGEFLNSQKIAIFVFKLNSGCGAVRLARLVRDQEAGGSNPLTPTTKEKASAICRGFLFSFYEPGDFLLPEK
jgi:hypothetical protein